MTHADPETPAASAAIPETLLEFPCLFPIKAMGLADQDITTLVVEILERHAAQFRHDEIRKRASANGKWLSVTVVVHAQSKNQLDAIYQELTAHQSIVYAL